MIKESVIAELQKIVGKDNVKTEKEALRAYSTTDNELAARADVVVFSTSTKEISEIMKWANAEAIYQPYQGVVEQTLAVQSPLWEVLFSAQQNEQDFKG